MIGDAGLFISASLSTVPVNLPDILPFKRQGDFLIGFWLQYPHPSPQRGDSDGCHASQIADV